MTHTNHTTLFFRPTFKHTLWHNITTFFKYKNKKNISIERNTYTERWMVKQLFSCLYIEIPLLVLKMKKSFSVFKIWKIVEDNYDVYLCFQKWNIYNIYMCVCACVCCASTLQNSWVRHWLRRRNVAWIG